MIGKIDSNVFSGFEPYREFRYGLILWGLSHIQTHLLSYLESFFFFQENEGEREGKELKRELGMARNPNIGRCVF